MAELTDAIVRFSGEFPILSYMTSNGDKTFVIYQISIQKSSSDVSGRFYTPFVESLGFFLLC